MIYLLLDTTTPTCRVVVVLGDDSRHAHEWQADRTLAGGLLAYLTNTLARYRLELGHLQGVAVLRGPGSFTGLRIGLTVMNTLADSLSIPIVGESGDSWQEKAVARLSSGENEYIVMPLYGAEARTTQPRK
jgi:tRNA threonylcarbamoyladenosine biosynthesis protein TsaB